jgi:hypothetical protein
MQVIQKRDQIKSALENAGLPDVGGFCFSAPQAIIGTSDNYGGPYDPIGSLKQNPTDFYITVPFEEADRLRGMSDTDTLLLIDAFQGWYRCQPMLVGH